MYIANNRIRFPVRPRLFTTWLSACRRWVLLIDSFVITVKTRKPLLFTQALPLRPPYPVPRFGDKETFLSDEIGETSFKRTMRLVTRKLYGKVARR